MLSNSCFALVDCNNFYVSCERVFRPDLWNKPVAVLSNNDGCIISRSAEVKKLDIKMAVPLHQVEYLVKKHNVQLFSSNYALYADLSSRVMSVLEEFTPRQEVYSIDEAFLDLTGIAEQNPTAYGQQIRKSIWRNTGLPVCVGIGPTKTLAKLANFVAKKWQKTGGVVDLSHPSLRNKLMRQIPVIEVWGIGSQTTKKLNQLSITSAWDLARQPVDFARSQFSVVVARTVIELNGSPSLSLEEIAPNKQQIICSRSFKNRITILPVLAEALTDFCSRAAEKLRAQNSVSGLIGISIKTNPFNPNEPQHQCSASLTLNHATQDTRKIVSTAKYLLKQIFKTGYRYHHCAVQLSKLEAKTAPRQMDLFDTPTKAENYNSQRLMSAVDQINQRFPNSIALASRGFDKRWQFKVEKRSPRYTSCWDELVPAKCK
jgi:DNA polymerase V